MNNKFVLLVLKMTERLDFEGTIFEQLQRGPYHEKSHACVYGIELSPIQYGPN